MRKVEVCLGAQSHEDMQQLWNSLISSLSLLCQSTGTCVSRGCQLEVKGRCRQMPSRVPQVEVSMPFVSQMVRLCWELRQAAPTHGNSHFP